MRKGMGIVLVIGIFLTAASIWAGGKQEPAGSEETADSAVVDDATGDDLKAAVVMSGPINDGGWNTSAYEGLMMLKKDLGYTVAYIENVYRSERKERIRRFAEEGYDLIFGHGPEFGSALVEASGEFPETHFFNIGGSVQSENCLENWPQNLQPAIELVSWDL